MTNPTPSFDKWLKKRINANRSHFIKNLDLPNWPAGKYIEYKGNLFAPIRLDWPEGRDYGVLFLRPVGTVRKLQSGPSTKILPISPGQIRIQISHELSKKKK